MEQATSSPMRERLDFAKIMFRFPISMLIRSFLLLSVFLSDTGRAVELPADVKAFVEKHCLECHNAETKSAGLSFSEITFELDNRPTSHRWVRIHDRVLATRSLRI